jgi:hypothetical protein
MDRCALFVDAGYLFAAGGELCCGTRSRQGIRLDAAGLNAELRDLTALRCGLRVLRTYWYDGAREGIPTPSQQEIAALPNVKLRLGRLNHRNQQKGVDALIYRDLMTLARERAIAEAFLLSGDEDLREGVRAAQDMGVRVTLLGIPPVSQDFNQSKELVHEADEVHVLEQGTLARYLTLVEPELPVVAEAPVSLNVDVVEALGRELATQWWDRASDAEQEALQAQRPRIPPTLDVELIKRAEDRLRTNLRGRDGAHRALRRGFWSALPGASDND